MTGTLNKQAVDAASAGSPAWLRAYRERAWETYDRLPVPGRRDIEWRHFDLRPVHLDALAAPTPAKPAVNVQLTGLTPELTRQGVLLCDLPTAVAKHPDILREHLGQSIAAEEPRKFAALHAALFNTGALLYVPRGVTVPAPIEITYEFQANGVAGLPHTLLVLEPGAEATVVQRFTSRGDAAATLPAAPVHAGGVEVFVKEAARLHYVSAQTFGPTVHDFTVKRARVGRDAEIDWVVGMFGAALQRVDVECVMEGPGATSYMYGVGIGRGHQQFGQFTRQHHRTGPTVSDLLFKNVFRDTAVGSYAGLIKVDPNANGTNAYQSNRNLVLSDKVQCDTRPILEIESNQLRCTHGATVGRLDEAQLYYLRSRGLRDADARQILIAAFVEPVLARIRLDAVREEFAALVQAKLGAA